MRSLILLAYWSVRAFGFTAPIGSPRRPSMALHDSNRAGADDLEQIWRTHSKPLLRIGSNGVQDSHRRSLDELLDAHAYVCVKINGCSTPEMVSQRAQELQPQSAAILLTKGASVLYFRATS